MSSSDDDGTPSEKTADVLSNELLAVEALGPSPEHVSLSPSSPGCPCCNSDTDIDEQIFLSFLDDSSSSFSELPI
uniref:Uncharacterized protein n=1 Tax=Angiostrongylus cantonensis TaxID=6313 RepID=A0A0K0DK35_ANGCA